VWKKHNIYIYTYTYIYTAEEEEEETVLCNPFLLTNCLTCVYACSKHISSFLLLHRTLELEHSLFFALIVKNTHIHFQRFHAFFFVCVLIVWKREFCLYRKHVVCYEKSVSMCWFLNYMCEYTKDIRLKIETSHLHKCQKQKILSLFFFLED
jgi:hypothetical protein